MGVSNVRGYVCLDNFCGCWQRAAMYLYRLVAYNILAMAVLCQTCVFTAA